MNYEILIGKTKRIETLLRSIGAQGKGIHSLANSVSDRLPNEIEAKLRFIASIRNKALHEDRFILSDADWLSFESACDESASSLQAIAQRLSKTAQPKADGPSNVSSNPRESESGHVARESADAASKVKRNLRIFNPDLGTLSLYEISRESRKHLLNIIHLLVTGRSR